MRHRHIFISNLIITLSLFLCFSPCIATSHIDSVGASLTYQGLYNLLNNMILDVCDSAEVSNVTLRRDVAFIHLEYGSIYLCRPIGDRVCGVVFIGNGTFNFKPPMEVEQSQLRRFYDSDSLHEEFDALFIIFGDSTEYELRSKLNFKATVADSKVKKVIKESLKYMGEKNKMAFDSDIMKTFLDNRENSLYYAYISRELKPPLFFKINPYAEEQVILQTKKFKTYDPIRETVCLFPLGLLNADSMGMKVARDTCFLANRYRMDCSFDNSLGFSAVAMIEIMPKLENQNWINFVLHSDLIVDSVFLGNGEKAEYFQAAKSPDVWVQCRPPLRANITDTITLYYHGEIIKELTHVFFLKSSIEWHPTPEERNYAIYDLTFRYPSQYTLVSVGDKVEDTTINRVRTTRWLTSKPIRNASFNIGIYDEYKIEDDRIPSVTVLISELGHREVREALLDMGMLSGKDMEKQVGADVANSMALFQQIYGKCPVDNFYATEISTPIGGEAFPGLIHLPLLTFQRTDHEGYDRMLRAHEVAHQWWGFGVDYASYRDKWLSEAFAEYSGLWYMQSILKDNDKFFARLTESRDAIWEDYRSSLGEDKFSGPICLGFRASSSERPDAYELMSYYKGAWVLHMLRNMSIDLKTMNEDGFLNLMKDYYTTFNGKRATTNDFQFIVEKHFGEDMNWFFNQWVYEIDIPQYKFSYKIESADEEKYLVTCRVKQMNVSDDFKMLIPLFIDFGDDRTARVRIWVQGPETIVTLPLLPLKPKKIKFNDLESVLCKYDNEKWRD